MDIVHTKTRGLVSVIHSTSEWAKPHTCNDWSCLWGKHLQGKPTLLSTRQWGTPFYHQHFCASQGQWETGHSARGWCLKTGSGHSLKVIQIPMDCTHLHPFASVSTSFHPLLQIFLCISTSQISICNSNSHRSHLYDLSIVLLPHLYIWMSPVKYSLSQMSLTYLHHTKIPHANIRHAWISKEMKTGHRKEVSWGKRWRCNAKQPMSSHGWPHPVSRVWGFLVSK